MQPMDAGGCEGRQGDSSARFSSGSAKLSLHECLSEHCRTRKEDYPVRMNECRQHLALNSAHRKTYIDRLSLDGLHTLAIEERFLHQALKIRCHQEIKQYPLRISWRGPYLGCHFRDVPLKWVKKVAMWCRCNPGLATHSQELRILLQYNHLETESVQGEPTLEFYKSNCDMHGRIAEHLIPEHAGLAHGAKSIKSTCVVRSHRCSSASTTVSTQPVSSHAGVTSSMDFDSAKVYEGWRGFNYNGSSGWSDDAPWTCQAPADDGSHSGQRVANRSPTKHCRAEAPRSASDIGYWSTAAGWWSDWNSCSSRSTNTVYAVGTSHATRFQ